MADYPKCNHITTKGTICESPALRNNSLCYYHHRDQLRQSNFQQARALKQSKDFAAYPAQQELLNIDLMESLEIPALDDHASIQVALTNISRAILSGHIDSKRAGLLLYALQIAAINVEKLQLKVYATDRRTANDPVPLRPLIRPHIPHDQADMATLKKQIASTLASLPPEKARQYAAHADHFPYAGARPSASSSPDDKRAP